MDRHMTDGWIDRHADVQRETIILGHYCVAGYRIGIMCVFVLIFQTHYTYN